MSVTAMILAAGRGERIAPLSLDLPKPALPVLGRPLILRTVDRLSAAGVGRLAVNLHHRQETLRRLLDPAPPGIRSLHFSVERDLLGTGGGVRQVLPFLRDGGPVVVLWNGDAHADLDLELALAAHRAAGVQATLVLREGDTARYGAVREREGRVTGFDRLSPGETAAGRPLVFTGIHLVDPALIARLAPGTCSDLVRDLYWPMLAAGEPLGSFVHEGRWIEIGSPRLYLRTLLDVAGSGDAEGQTWLAASLARQPREGGWLWLGPGADASHAVRIEGTVILETDARAAEGAHLADAVLLDGAQAGPGASVTRSVVGPGAVVPAGLRLRDVAAVHDPGGKLTLPGDCVRRGGLILRPLGLVEAP